MQEPTYEQYKKANNFARFRYKYGLFVLILCWLALLFLIFYVVTNIEEMKSGDIRYCMKKQNLECVCYNTEGDSFLVNSTNIVDLSLPPSPTWEQKK